MNIDELAELARGYRDDAAAVPHEVRVCMAASCQSSGAQPVFEALTAARDKAGAGAAAGADGAGAAARGDDQGP